MKQLLENWRKFVNESSTGKKLEGYTTKLSREIVEAIKDEDLRAYFAENGKAQFKMQVDALDEIDNVRDLYIVMQAVPEEYWHPPMAVAGKYENTIGGDQEEIGVGSQGACCLAAVAGGALPVERKLEEECVGGRREALV